MPPTESAHVHFDYCSHVDPNGTHKDKEKEPRQQIWAEKEKDLFDESVVDAW